jgi:3-hydroxy-9,10-secoandrosta-1,3,5(10)-triene-9,17-dione monooxygenase
MAQTDQTPSPAEGEGRGGGAGVGTARTPEVSPPEPDLTSEEIIARAAALRPMLRDQQDESERRGCYSEEIHAEFLKAGFYRMVQPRRFGGYEFDLPTFWRAMVNISEGDPGSGWCLTLGSHHAFVVGSFWPERAQREIFGPDGDFRAPHRPLPGGTATPVAGGYVVDGTWDYCSGVPYATHFIGNALLPGTDPPEAIVVVIPIGQCTVLDDWGGGAQLGMQASGSNSVRVEQVFVPEHLCVPANWTRREGATPGTELHGNPMYLGMIYGVYHAGLVVTVVGAAKASLAELEHSITTRKTTFPPQVMRYEHYDYQRTYGLARGMADAAEELLYRAGEIYMERCQRWADRGEVFTREDDIRLFGMLQQAGRLASESVELVFRSAGSSAAKRGQRLQRYFRDVVMYRGHLAAQYNNLATEFAKAHFGIPDQLF